MKYLTHKMASRFFTGIVANLVVCSCMLFSALFGNAYAVIEAVEFDSPKQEQRYHALIDELRCLVCQNQNLADSDAELAKDLRQKTLEMLKAGNSDQEILNYMRERYGDFVLYRPPFNPTTAFLWIGPLLLLLFVAIAILVSIKRKQSATASEPVSNEQQQKVRELIGD